MAPTKAIKPRSKITDDDKRELLSSMHRLMQNKSEDFEIVPPPIYRMQSNPHYRLNRCVRKIHSAPLVSDNDYYDRGDINEWEQSQQLSNNHPRGRYQFTGDSRKGQKSKHSKSRSKYIKTKTMAGKSNRNKSSNTLKKSSTKYKSSSKLVKTRPRLTQSVRNSKRSIRNKVSNRSGRKINKSTCPSHKSKSMKSTAKNDKKSRNVSVSTTRSRKRITKLKEIRSHKRHATRSTSKIAAKHQKRSTKSVRQNNRSATRASKSRHISIKKMKNRPSKGNIVRKRMTARSVSNRVIKRQRQSIARSKNSTKKRKFKYQ